MKKYEILENETKTFRGHTLYRIKALKNFSMIRKGTIGGWIESEENLSQDDWCWVGDEAIVCEYARIEKNACVYDNATIYGYATISQSSCVRGNAIVRDCALVRGNSLITDEAIVEDAANVCNSIIDEFARVSESGIIKDSRVTNNAIVRGQGLVTTSQITDNAVIKQEQAVRFAVVRTDLSKNLIENIRCQTNLIPVNGKVIAYKQVRSDLSSWYDPDFVYKIGETVEVEDYDESDISCGKGLHFSNPNYFNCHLSDTRTVILIAEIDLDDIITVQEGKIRCKRAKIIGKYDFEV